MMMTLLMLLLKGVEWRVEIEIEIEVEVEVEVEIEDVSEDESGDENESGSHSLHSRRGESLLRLRLLRVRKENSQSVSGSFINNTKCDENSNSNLSK
jgi:hypothetical protein